MRRLLWATLLLWPALCGAQEPNALISAIFGSPKMLPPTVDATGRIVVLGSAITPEGATTNTIDLYAAASDGSSVRRLTRLGGDLRSPSGANSLALAPDASRAAFTMLAPSGGKGGEEVHVLEVATGASRRVAADTEGCILPLEMVADCPFCFLTCLYGTHLSPDASKVLYAARRSQPFYVVNADGSGLRRLPVYSGGLAPSPQRVISRNGLMVFTSSAPLGPTFAAAPADVYVMNLDGTNIRQVTRFESPSLYAWNATISADGNSIAFESNRDPDRGAAGDTRHIWWVRTDGSGLRPLTANVVCLSLDCPRPAPYTSPSISGDGSLVAFVAGGQVHVARSDRSAVKVVTQFRMSAAQDPALSENTSTVVFGLGPRNGAQGAIYGVNSDGTNLRPVYAPRALNPDGVTSAVPGAAPSPGSLISAYGLNLAPDGLATATRFPLPEVLADVSLLVNGIPAPLLAVTPWQVNAQLPPEVPAGPAAFQLRFRDGTQGVAVATNVQSVAPAIFLLSATANQAAVLHGNTHLPVDRDHPAVAGEVVEIYGTGLGPTDPFVPAGTPAPASPPARTWQQPLVFVGRRAASVTFSGLAPGLAGVYQVNAIVPSGLSPGQYPVVWSIGNVSSASGGTITVK